MSGRVYVAPEGTGVATLGRTLPELMYRALDQFPNDRAFQNRAVGGWKSISLNDFRIASEEVAAGLRDSGCGPGDRAALFLPSDVYFCIVDMGCLLASVIDVPIYLTHGDDTISYVLQHSGARIAFVGSQEDADRIIRLSGDSSDLKDVVVLQSQAVPDSAGQRVRQLSFDELRTRGRARLASGEIDVDALSKEIAPDDVATVIYTSGTTGRPKGVMLTHENITYNALTAFSGLKDYRPGADGEVILSFLPLTHVFARTLQYGFMAHGSTVYFSDPDHISEDLRSVRPTIFATVPRLLEKVYTRIRERAALEKGIRQKLLNWALELAHAYDLAQPPKGAYRAKLKIADRLIFAKWREALGGRVKYIISGGAALSPEPASVFSAARVTVLQGYGLTESSPIIAYNRPDRNRPDTVGTLLPGLEVKLGEDGEILTRGPHVMKGYYQDPDRTAEVIDGEGWLHTGDVGEMTSDGFLRLTDRKKDLFKLSTGKYVMPQLLESRLTTEPLIEQVVVLGEGTSYCTALIFADQDVLRTFARSRGIDPATPIDQLVNHPAVVARYERIVEKANRGIDPWSTIKRFVVIPEHLTIESGLLTPTMKVRRAQVRDRYAAEIEALYRETADLSRSDSKPERSDHAEAVLL